MYFLHVVNSPTRFGTPYVPSSGSLCSCYHKFLLSTQNTYMTIFKDSPILGFKNISG